MADPLNASLPDSQDTNLDSSFNGLSFREKFIWDWYIRLKAQFVVCNDPVLSKSLDDISNEVNSLWQGNPTGIIIYSMTKKELK